MSRNYNIEEIEEGIIHILWADEVDIEIPDIDQVSVSFDEIVKGRLVKVISQMGNQTNITTEARNYAAQETPQLEALAYVITGLAQRIVLRFYIRIRKRKCPTKVFVSVEDATKWLRQFNSQILKEIEEESLMN